MADLTPWRRQIDEALGYGWGSHTFEDIQKAVDEGLMQAWCSPTSIVITEVLQYPQLKQLYFFIGGGDLAAMEQMFPDIYKWGKAQGCTHAMFGGRLGWQRTFLSRQGWEVKPMVIMEKTL